MNGGIFLIQDNGQLIEMKQQAYDSEDILQELIAKYPNLMAGDQINSTYPRRWLLMTREASISSEEGGSGRWSVDHLFLDQDAIPTLIEVKRSSDTRIRREVVGQMMDYAANAVVYWPIETFQNQFELNCKNEGRDPAQVLAEHLGEDYYPEQFWSLANDNLKLGRIRMIFIADIIPPELKRIVEFMNVQMNPAEVLAIEIRQFVNEGLKTLVPRVIGLTANTENKSPTGGSRKWDEQSLCDELNKKYGTEVTSVVKKIITWAKVKGFKSKYGKGRKFGSLYHYHDNGSGNGNAYIIWTDGTITLQFDLMRNTPPFDIESKRFELIQRLNKIKGLSLPEESINKWQGFPIELLTKKEELDKFLDAFEWFYYEAESESKSPSGID